LTQAAAAPRSRRRPVFTLIALFGILALSGAVRQWEHPGRGVTLPGTGAQVYLSLMAMEWGLVLYLVRAGGRPIGELIGGRWRGPVDVARDVALAVLVWGGWTALSFGARRALGPDPAGSVRALLPHGPVEGGLWVALSLTAGFAEELVFRGYLLTELRAMTRSRAAGVVLQATVFGLAHAYEGARAVATIVLFGLVYGVVALRTRNLRPLMLAHALTDVAAGFW